MSSAAPPVAAASPPTTLTAAAASALAPAKADEYNRLKLDYHRPIPRPKVKGIVVDFHTHLIAARHAPTWIETAAHYGFDAFFTMTPLEEAIRIQRDWPGRFHFITIPSWQNPSMEDWLRRLEMFYNLGSRIIKFHMAPGTMFARKVRMDADPVKRVMREAADRNMILMSHVGDPDTWYNGKYSDASKYGSREDHYKMWEAALTEYRDRPWLGAHLGGNPENFPRLQSLFDRFPNLYLDCSATRWMVREVSLRRDEARAFFIRNSDRILFGTDQVSGDDRGFDFLASRMWCHRQLWESDYVGPSPIVDPDLPLDKQPELRGLALPDDVLQKIYHDNGLKMLARVGATLGEV